MNAALSYAAIAGLCASSAAADGAPFYRCSFDDGRVVDLALTDDGFEWQERDFRAQMVSEPQAGPDPIISYVGIWDDPERIDVFVGWQSDGGPAMDIGVAMLSRTIITDTGAMVSSTTPGTCADYAP